MLPLQIDCFTFMPTWVIIIHTFGAGTAPGVAVGKVYKFASSDKCKKYF